jgi:tetratricopeptide (TPR) repeat protein
VRALALAVATWLVLFLVSSSAQAQADADRFRELVQQATEAFGRGEFERAIELTDAAYAIKPHPRLLYNRARAHEALGHAEQAIADYQSYLERDPESEDKETVSGRIKALRAELARRDAMRRRQHELAKQQPAPAEPQAASSGPGAAPWITLGVGGAGLAAGGVLALLSRQRYDDAETAGSGERAAELRDSGDGLTTGANVAFVVGGAVVISSLIWLWLAQTDAPETTASFRW